MKRLWNPTWLTRFRWIASSDRVRLSVGESVKGFSTKTWTSRSSASLAYAKWVEVGVETITASRRAAWIISSWWVKVWTPAYFRRTERTYREVSQTATTASPG